MASVSNRDMRVQQIKIMFNLYSGNCMYIPVHILLIPSVWSLCFDTDLLTTQNKYLENNLLGTTAAVNVVDCAAVCQSYQQCQSFGFDPLTASCHLHEVSSDFVPADFILKTNWIHGNLNVWPKTLFGPCANHSCPVGQTCNVNKISGDQICLKANLVLPGDLCPVPPEVTNAVLSPGGQEIGASRTYTCQDEYLDTQSFLTSAVTTCLPDNTWAPVNLTCSGPYIRQEMGLEPSYVFHNIETDQLNRLTGSTSSLIFLVKTCHDCNILLHSDLDYTQGTMYEVVFGGWYDTKSGISRGISSDLVEVNQDADILSCTEFNPFWLSYANGVISAGKGNIVGAQTLLSWTISPPMDVNFVSYSSHVSNSGVWYFLVQP